MVTTILVDEFHVSLRAPRGLLDAEYVAMRKTLDSTPFRVGLRRATSDVVRRFASLSKVKVNVSR